MREQKCLKVCMLGSNYGYDWGTGRAELEYKCCAVLICSIEAIEPYPISCHLRCFRIKTATGGLGQ